MIPIDILRRAGLSEEQIARVFALEQEAIKLARRGRNRRYRVRVRDGLSVSRDGRDVSGVSLSNSAIESTGIKTGETSRASQPSRARAEFLDKKDPPSYSPSENTTEREPDFFANEKTGEDPGEPLDEPPRAKLYRIGKLLLVTFGVAEKRTGSVIGHWLKRCNDPDGLLAAIQYARDANVAEPIAYISALVNGGSGNGTNQGAALAYEIADALERRERDERAGFPFGGGAPRR